MNELVSPHLNELTLKSFRLNKKRTESVFSCVRLIVCSSYNVLEISKHIEPLIYTHNFDKVRVFQKLKNFWKIETLIKFLTVAC